jgi:hypothetical protein
MHLTRRYRTSSLILSSTPNRTLRLLCCCALLAAFRHILVELTEPLASRPLRRRDPNVLPLLPRVEPTIQGVARKLELVVHQLLQYFFTPPSRSTCPVWVVFSVAYLTVALCSLAAHSFPLVEILDWLERSLPADIRQVALAPGKIARILRGLRALYLPATRHIPTTDTLQNHGHYGEYHALCAAARIDLRVFLMPRKQGWRDPDSNRRHHDSQSC